MKISVLIPTYNAEVYVEDLLDKLYSQILPENSELEIIIIDSSSKDRTAKIIKEKYKHVNFEVINNKDFDHGGTRNLMARKASGDYLLFMTQDAIPYDEQLILNLVSNFKDPLIKIAYARQIPKKDAGPLEVFARTFNYPDKKVYKSKETIKELGIKTFFNSNVCSMYDAELFSSKDFGGFPEKVILNEDMILSFNVIMEGYKVCYDNKALVYHSHNYNLKQQFKRYFDIGMAFNDTKYILDHVSNEKEGMRMVGKQQEYLIKNKYSYLIPYSILETGIKYLSYQLGKRHQLFSYRIKKRMSAYLK